MSALENAINALMGRLEQVTNRLERVEKQLGSGSAPATSAASHHAASDDSPASASVTDFEDLIQNYIPKYVELSGKIGDKDVLAQAELVQAAVRAQRDCLEIASKSKKPDDATLGKIVQSTSEKIMKIKELREKAPRSHKFFNHLSAVSEGIDALIWFVVTPKPGPHATEARNQSLFYSNKVLTEYKGKDQNHIDWVGAFVNGFLKDLPDYIKKHHTTGVTWNPKGVDAASVKVSGASAASASKEEEGGAPPPPPPGPPPPPPTAEELGISNNNNAKQSDMSAVFSQLNKGEGVTAGLKKVTADMKTKNRTDKGSSVVPAAAFAKKEVEDKSSKSGPKRPPKISLDGNKWTVEFQENNKNIVIAETEPKHTVYIYKCTGSVIQIKGKVNAITIDDCAKTAIVFENCIAVCEVVNCRSVEVQVVHKIPAFAIDKTSGCQLYISKESLECEIVTSKSSEMNVLIPNPQEEGDMIEMPIPEQYKTLIKNHKLVTEISSHV